MDWFPFYVCDLSSPKISAASSHAFGAWVRALGNCYKHENGGCYEQCSEHSDRQWMSVAGVDREEIASIVSAGLATWEGANLRIDGYDKEQEKKATSRKEKGAKAAEIRWSNARSNARSITLSNTEERRGEEKKGEGEEIPARDPSGTATEYGEDSLTVSTVSGLIHCMRVAIEKAQPENGMWNPGGPFAQREAEGFLSGFGGSKPVSEIRRRIDLFAADASMAPWTVKKFVSEYNRIGIAKPHREPYYPHGRPTTIDEIPDMPIIVRKKS